MNGPRHALAIAALLLALRGAALADGVVRDSVGPIAGGRGGANIAFSDNGAVLLSNPSGMANLVGKGLFEGGIDVLVTSLDYSDPLTGDVDNSEGFGLPMLSLMSKFGDGRLAAGIGFFAPAGFGSDWDMNGQFPLAGEQTYKSLGGLFKILPGVAWQLTDDLSVGATLGVAVSHAELEGPFTLQSGPAAGVPTFLDLQATGATPTWSVGMQYRLTDTTLLGAVYTSEDRFRLEGSAEATAFGLTPAPLTSRFDVGADLVWPQSVGVGVQQILSERSRIGLDVIWYDWSHAFDRLDLEFTDPTNPAFLLLGPQITDSLPLRWNDSISVRVGLEHALTPLDVVRTGYVFNSDTAPNSTLTPYIPAILDHTVSAGYSHRWNEWSFNAAYQFAFGSERRVEDSAILGGDFQDSTFKSQAHWAMFSVMRQF